MAAPSLPVSATRLGLLSATALVVANMIGTGIFTSTGYQAAALPSSSAILLLWLAGGVLALCGALTYGELAAAYPRSGGEYNFLSRLYHPSLGFASAFISLVAGFAAPIAVSALAFGKYLALIAPGADARLYAGGLVLLLTLLHSLDLKYGARVQNSFTLLKAGLILLFGLSGVLVPLAPADVFQNPTEGQDLWTMVFSGAFATSLVYVSFAYSGWNAAAYVTDEVTKPARTVPRALLLGTLIVMALYLLLNAAYLLTVPLARLAGVDEVAYLPATVIFGPVGARFITGTITLALVSSVGSMVLVGPRVMKAVGQDLPAFRRLATPNRAGVPVYALLLQSAIALVIVVFSGLQQALEYIGFTLNLFAFLTVAGVFIHRWRVARGQAQPSPVRTPLYPMVPLLFLLLSGWMTFFLIQQRGPQSLWGLGTVVMGLALYYMTRRGKLPSHAQD